MHWVERVNEWVTFELQQRVLRPHMTLDEVKAERAEQAVGDAAAYAALGADLVVVGCGTIRSEATPFEAEGPVWRIRSMAVEPELRGQGIGGAVLEALLDHAAERGGGTVWCNARTPALGLYRRAGFEARGDEFEIAGIGPHVVMARTVDGIGSGHRG